MPIAAFLVIQALRLYELLIFVWVFGSFFPQWRYQAWYKFVGDVVQPYLNLFRKLPLQIPMGASTMDLSPMVAIFALELFIGLISAAVKGGLH